MSDPEMERLLAGPVIGLDPDGTLDEFFLTGCDVHFEAMSDNEWWIGIYKDGKSWAINVGAVNPRAKAYARLEEDR